MFIERGTRLREAHALRPAASVILCSTLLLLAGGCNAGKKSRITVVRYPSFYMPELKRIAVLPFDNPPSDSGAGERIGQRLETALTRNNTYEVYTRQRLKEVLQEQDLALSGIIDAEAAQRIGRLGSVQALVCGVCDQYASGTRQEIRTRKVPIWGTTSKGVPVITGWREERYLWTRNEAVVQCNVQVIDTVTGRQLTAVNEISNGWSEGSPPKFSQWQVLQLTERDQLIKLLREIAVVRSEIKLKGTVLRIATGQYDAKWDWQDRLTPSDGQFLAVVSLPEDAGRNTFKITIVPKDGREVIAEQEFVWPELTSENSYPFDINEIVEKNGFGAYQAKLYSGAEPFAWYHFSIVERR